MAPDTTHHLTPHDALILTHIFPDQSPSTCFIDPSKPTPSPSLQTQESNILLPLASTSVSPSTSMIRIVIAHLDKLIATHPNYASAYNNRAQASRLLVGDDLRHRAVAQSGVWADLGRAIELVKQSGASRGGAVSKAEAGVAAKALVQRALLVRRCASGPDPAGKEKENSINAEGKADDMNLQEHPNSGNLPQELRGLSKYELEGLVLQDFAAAGRYGDAVAAAVARKSDPYAQLCAGVVREAMMEEMSEGWRVEGERV